MESEKLSKCENCEREIAESKLALHEAYCRRNIIRCPKCKLPVDKNEMEAHEQETHAKKKCSDCGLEMDKTAMESHSKYCSKKPKECKFCSVTVPAGDFSEHIYACGSRTKICPSCRKNIILRDFEHHEITCALESANVPKNFPKLEENKKPAQPVPSNLNSFANPQVSNANANAYQPALNRPNPIPKLGEDHKASELKNKYEPLAGRKPVMEKNIAPSQGNYTNSAASNVSAGLGYSNQISNSFENKDSGISSKYAADLQSRAAVPQNSASINKPSYPSYNDPSKNATAGINPSRPGPENRLYEDNKPASVSSKPLPGGPEPGRYSGAGLGVNAASNSINNKIGENRVGERPGSNSGLSKHSIPSNNNRVPIATGISQSRVPKDPVPGIQGNSVANPKPGFSGSSYNNAYNGKIQSSAVPQKESASSGKDRFGYSNQNSYPSGDVKTDDRYKKAGPSMGVSKDKNRGSEKYDEILAKQLMQEEEGSSFANRKPLAGANIRPENKRLEPEHFGGGDMYEEDEELQRVIAESMKNKNPSNSHNANRVPSRANQGPNLNDTLNDEDYQEAIKRSKQFY